MNLHESSISIKKTEQGNRHCVLMAQPTKPHCKGRRFRHYGCNKLITVCDTGSGFKIDRLGFVFEWMDTFSQWAMERIIKGLADA